MSSARLSRRSLLTSAVTGAATIAVGRTLGNDSDNPLARWQAGIRISTVSKIPGRHTMHTYYLLNPESPDGRRVLFFASKDRAGQVGQICLIDRATGEESVLVDGIHTEDAHRVALQQWTDNGKSVAYHEVVNNRWQVVVVNVETGTKSIVAEDRQLGFGRPDGHLLPLYGCHWNPGSHRDLEIYNLKTGELNTAVRVRDVEETYGDWMKKEFGDRPTSIAFPTLSPDHKRVFCKISAGNGGHNFMSSQASHRQGIVFYDLQRQRLTLLREKWGHPAWHPDSIHCIEMGNILFDADGGPATQIHNVPALRGQHLAVSPCGRLFVSDGLTQSLGGPAGEWAVLVGDLRGERHKIVETFLGNRGARSWRVSHPHPVFSADSTRIYYNVSADEDTELHVAEAVG